MGGKWRLWEEGDGGERAGVLPMEWEVAVVGRGRWRSSDGSSAHGAGSGGHGKREMEENGQKFCLRGGKWRLWVEGNGGVRSGVLPME